jgi:uncharacterized protein YbjQ (UPF0145 family)
VRRTEGWYPDYQQPNGGWARYWDGVQWTDKIRADRQVTAEDVGRLRGELAPVRGGGRDATPTDSGSAVLITTGLEITGYRISEHIGEVFGLTVRARNAFSDAAASLRNFVGGEVAGYTKMLTDARIEAISRLRAEATRRKANGVIAMKMDANAIGDNMTELIAYGTAVVIEPWPSKEPVLSGGQVAEGEV